nr:MAG: 100 kDa protein [unidentified adenovirus]
MAEEQMGSIVAKTHEDEAAEQDPITTAEEDTTAAARTGDDVIEEDMTPPCVDNETQTEVSAQYLAEDSLFLHIKRQANILSEALQDALELPTTVQDLSAAYEKNLFCPKVVPKKQENGTLPANPRLNFYPTFITPETLATYHLFFQNQKIPLSCKLNRPRANQILNLSKGSLLPGFPTVEEVKRIFEGLGDEEVSKNALQKENSHLVELENDGPRAAVLKRNIALTHFAYPAVNLPPKVMSCVMSTLMIKNVEPQKEGEEVEMEPSEVVSNEEIIRWLHLSGSTEEIEKKIQERRKMMMAVVLVSVVMQSIRRFFTSPSMIKKIGETLHYTFHHGYVKQAIKIANVDLTNIVSYMGILHENRVGQSTLHQTLSGNNRLDYVRDTIFLWLIYTWQTAMGVWQQCMESSNTKELEKILNKVKRNLWTGSDEESIAIELSEIIFPHDLMNTLKQGLPDLTNQSMMQQFRDFILERSGVLPAMCSALPTDFIPLAYKECPPPLWPYTYFLHLANYFMYHNDLQVDSSGEGLLDCYCRCNLCTPHRSLATNTALLNEVQSIGTFELQGPPNEDGSLPAPLKLTAGAWASAYLRKFEHVDYYPFKILYYEDQKKPQAKAELTACVITQSQILAQLQNIRKAREEFLLKKGHGVYLDPQTGEELNTSAANSNHNEAARRNPADNGGRHQYRGGSGRGSGARSALQRGHRSSRRKTTRISVRFDGDTDRRGSPSAIFDQENKTQRKAVGSDTKDSEI